MSDDQLLIYSYMKERSVLEQDTSKSGDKKQARLKELDENIKELGDKYS
ncbi:type VII secretion protein EssB/YukC [Lachnobacterium bovis]|nr:type VII secretion protein EssB/YukC [Lachnobacterium bovis]